MKFKLICTLKFGIREMAALVGKQMQSSEAIHQQKVAVTLLHQDDRVFDVKDVWRVPVCDWINTALHTTVHTLLGC